MGLRSSFELLLGSPDPLGGMDELIWQSLSAAASAKQHPWKEGYFSTVQIDSEGNPQPRSRTVILRRASREAGAIDFHTDSRSSKIGDLEQANVCWLFYSTDAKIQLRMEGTASVIEGGEADEAWKRTPLQSRAAYLSVAVPGTAVDAKFPPSTADRNVDLEGSERGRQNFRIVRTRVHAIDWLYLRKGGHVRAQLTYSLGSDRTAQWVVP